MSVWYWQSVLLNRRCLSVHWADRHTSYIQTHIHTVLSLAVCVCVCVLYSLCSIMPALYTSLHSEGQTFPVDETVRCFYWITLLLCVNIDENNAIYWYSKWVCLFVCLSVCLSVTLRYCINMVELSWIAVSFWRSHFSYNIKPANGQNLETWHTSRLQNYFYMIRCYICPLWCFINLKYFGYSRCSRI